MANGDPQEAPDDFLSELSESKLDLKSRVSG